MNRILTSMKFRMLVAGLLASVAIAAVSVVSAAGSTGGHFTSDAPGAWTVIEGHQVGGSEWNYVELPVSGFNMHCPSVGTKFAASVGGATQTQITALAFFPTVCEISGGFGGTVTYDINGCDFLFTVESGPSGQTAAHLTCPAGKEILSTADPTLVGTCVIHIPPQTPTSGGVVYTPTTDNGKESMKLDVTLVGITHNLTPSGFLGCGGATGENNNKHLTSTVTLTATDTAGNPANIRATGP